MMVVIPVLQPVSRHVIENEEIGFEKFGTELRTVVCLHRILACNVITCLESLLIANAISSFGVLVTLERSIVLGLRSNCTD